MAIDKAKLNAFMGNFVHDMGDPVGASAHVLKSLRPDGTQMKRGYGMW